MPFNIKEHQERLSLAVKTGKQVVAISTTDYFALISAWKNLNWKSEHELQTERRTNRDPQRPAAESEAGEEIAPLDFDRRPRRSS